MVLLEVCIDSADGLRRAVAGGADRLEVCSRLDLDGLSAEEALLAAAHGAGVPWFAMVRPRQGSHVWRADEHAALFADLDRARACGAAGFVLGAITRDGEVDAALIDALVRHAAPLPVTFHRAFDRVRDPFAGLETLVGLGVRRILTSGGAADAFTGRDRIRELVDRARGRIVILPGGGVRAHNASAILAATGATELHSSTVFDLRRP